MEHRRSRGSMKGVGGLWKDRVIRVRHDPEGCAVTRF